MYKLLCLLFVGHYEPPCKHKWVILKTTDIVDEIGRNLRTRYYLQCEHCGDITNQEGG